MVIAMGSRSAECLIVRRFPLRMTPARGEYDLPRSMAVLGRNPDIEVRTRARAGLAVQHRRQRRSLQHYARDAGLTQRPGEGGKYLDVRVPTGERSQREVAPPAREMTIGVSADDVGRSQPGKRGTSLAHGQRRDVAPRKCRPGNAARTSGEGYESRRGADLTR